MNIALVVYSPGPGGAERVAATVANGLAVAGDSVTLFTLDDARSVPFFALSTDVRLIRLGRSSPTPGARSRLSRVVAKYLRLRREVRCCKPDLVVSFTSQVNILVLFALIGLSPRIFVSERSDPRVIPAQRAFRILRSVSYRWLAHCVLVQSEYARRYFASRGYPRVRVLANPVVVPDHDVRGPLVNDDCVTICGVGRLAPEKRWNVLIEAVAALAKRPGCAGRVVCVLFGDGPERPRLLELVRELGLEGTVMMPGFDASPWRRVRPYDIYVQCSRFEGFPNALFEAMAMGCAVVSTRYSPAADEILENGVNALLVDHDSPAMLASALETLATDSDLRRSLGDAARARMKRYTPEHVVPDWRCVLETA